MRLFKSNKSQGSLQNISAGKSPLHSPIESPLQSPAFPPPQSAAYGPGGAHYDESADPPDSQRVHSSDELAYFQSRGQSQNTANHASQGRPTVNVIPDHFDENHLFSLNATSATNQEEPRQRKHSKRSLFGLHSSKENTSLSPNPTLNFGRSISTTKNSQGQESQEASISQLAPAQYSGEGYSSDTYEEAERPVEPRPSQGNAEPDEQYYRQQNFDSPQSQTSSHHSPHGQDEGPYQNPQQTYYRPQPPPPASSSNQYLPYNPQPDRPSLDSYDPYHNIRPPSQLSLGPPSPISSIQQSGESRLPAVQGRQSNQPGQASPFQLQAGMARGESNNPSLRQQMVQQHQQGQEQGHGQYGMPQGPRQLQHQSSSMTEHGRSTPPPSKSREDISTQDYATLLQKHEELQAKYSKVKKYYFEKDAQVTALQNTVANQRLSMSKTTLDDHEYTARFNRLDGAIKDLSFNIRKDWKGIPPWLAAMVNRDAHAVGTKEMTAIGRACITRWVVDEILDRYFHPRLEPGLSSLLKVIEKNIRRASQIQVTSEEQRDDLIVKLTSWRLTTLEGLADIMATEQGNEYKQQLTSNLMEKLTASLQMNLNEPPPPGLESGVGMIIELAIGIAGSLPLESRDVYVEYYMPGSLINETYMRVESGIPPLTSPGVTVDFSTVGPDHQQQQQGGDQGSTDSGDNNSLGDNDGDQGGNGGSSQGKKDDQRKKGLFGGFGSSSNNNNNNNNKKEKEKENSGGSSSGGGLAPGSNVRMGSANSGISANTAKERESMEKLDRERRIRFAAFVGVEVRGKGKEGANVLVRAPCFGF